jgi:hypothetical protein
MSDRNVKDIHVDRESEKQLFHLMLQGNADAHILLIRADGGFGKSSLLREFREMSQVVPDRTSFIGLHSSQISEGIMFDSCFHLGQGNFNQFLEVCQEIVGMTSEREFPPQQKRNELKKILSERFNLDDLSGIAFDMGLNFENVPGNTLERKAIELILLAERNERLDELIDQVRQRRPEILSNAAFGRNKIYELNNTLRARVGSNISKMDREQRLIFHRLLTAAFFDDLTKLHHQLQQRLVFIFDTFNDDINADVKDWISEFINSARKFPWLNVVVAGRQFPSLKIDNHSSYYRHELKPFKLQDLQEFVRQVGLNLKPEDMDLLYESTRGEPLFLATILDNLYKARAKK